MAVLAAAGLLRLYYCYDTPVSGDEAVSLVQASGQAVASGGLFPDVPGPVSGINRIIEYSDEFGIGDVLESMRKAGMHPPFYYVFLHFILKHFGTDLIALRLPSVIFSTLSIAVFYALSRELFSKFGAWLATLLLAFSSYGIHYAHMIRPYPLMMLLSLLSTWLLLRLQRKDQFCLSSAGFWVYTALVVTGFYTLYHFLFVFVFQLLFLLLSAGRDRRQLTATAGAGLVATVCYLPWLPSFFDQLRIVTGDRYYYYGSSSLTAVYRYFLEFNFTQSLPGGINWYKILLAILITGAIGAGGLWSLKTKRGRCFAAAAAGYFVISYLADRLMQMQTLNISKLLFFAVPLIVLYLGAGLQLFARRRSLGILVLSIVAGVGLFSSGQILKNPVPEDTPQHIPLYRTYIGRTKESPPTTLVVLNERARRSIFPLSHIMGTDGFDFLASDDFPGILQNTDLAAYADVYILSPRINRILEPNETEMLGQIMHEKGFKPQDGGNLPAPLDPTRLQHYKRPLAPAAP
jgi:uncharacterized membrane protein